MEWSPQHAMQAYLQTLHLICKYKLDNGMDQKEKYSPTRTKGRKCQDTVGTGVVEPNGSEFISALAAGNQAKVLVQVMANRTNHGITPMTIALAVAATQTGGKLICIIPYHHHHITASTVRHQLSLYGLLSTEYDGKQHRNDVVELRVGHPKEHINDLKNVDFAVIDGQLDDYDDRLCQSLHLNPKGAIIVANNWLYTGKTGVTQLVDQLLRGRRGVQSSVRILPLETKGHVQVILKIRSMDVNSFKLPLRRHKRFLVTFNF